MLTPLPAVPGMVAGMGLVVTALAGSQDKLLEFAADMAAEEPSALGGPSEASSSTATTLDPAYRALMPKAD